MGDLNTDYDDEPLIPLLEQRLKLSAWQPDQESVTFPKLKKRLDWILVSDQLEIVNHEILEEPVSDHRLQGRELLQIRLRGLVRAFGGGNRERRG